MNTDWDRLRLLGPEPVTPAVWQQVADYTG